MHMWNKWLVKIKANWWWLEAAILAAIILIGGYLRFNELAEPPTYMFDEVYHVPTIKMMARGDPRAYEWWHGELKEETQSGAYVDWLHPPLAKLIAAASVRLLSENSFAWRAPSALAGTVLIWVVYALARAIFPQARGAGLIAAFLVAVDGLTITQSRIAMNDIFVTLFTTAGLLTYYLYNQKEKDCWLLLTALMSGLACASKWSGAVLGLFLIVFELIKLKERKNNWIKMGRFLFISGLMTGLIYLLSFWQLFLHHNWSHFLELENQVILYQTNLQASHPYSSSAWWWPLGYKPVYIYLDATTGKAIWNRPNYLFWYIGVICLVNALYWLWRRKTPKKFKEKLLFLISAYFCFWLPWCFSPRIMFFHHYLPAATIMWTLSGGIIATWRKNRRVND